VLPSGERAKNARNISLPSIWQYYLASMATSLDKLENNNCSSWKIGTDPSSARKVLSYGEKIAKIGPANPEIFDKIHQTTT